MIGVDMQRQVRYGLAATKRRRKGFIARLVTHYWNTWR